MKKPGIGEANLKGNLANKRHSPFLSCVLGIVKVAIAIP